MDLFDLLRQTVCENLLAFGQIDGSRLVEVVGLRLAVHGQIIPTDEGTSLGDRVHPILVRIDRQVHQGVGGTVGHAISLEVIVGREFGQPCTVGGITGHDVFSRREQGHNAMLSDAAVHLTDLLGPCTQRPLLAVLQPVGQFLNQGSKLPGGHKFTALSSILGTVEMLRLHAKALSHGHPEAGAVCTVRIGQVDGSLRGQPDVTSNLVALGVINTQHLQTINSAEIKGIKLLNPSNIVLPGDTGMCLQFHLLLLHGIECHGDGQVLATQGLEVLLVEARSVLSDDPAAHHLDPAFG